MGYTPPQLEVRKVAGGYSIFPPSTTVDDDATIYPNGVDTLPAIKMEGNDYLSLRLAASRPLYIIENATNCATFSRSAPDFVITALEVNGSIALVPNGAGVVQFGTHTGSGDVACNGSIAMKDAAGNARKLMTTA
jgi:hypothetical protein